VGGRFWRGSATTDQLLYNAKSLAPDLTGIGKPSGADVPL